MIIYLDIDDVVADWHKAAEDLLKIKWNKDTELIPDEDWNRIKSTSRFYRHLPLKANARNLVNWCRNAVIDHRIESLRFLTAIPCNNDMPWAIQDKVWWAYDHFPGIPVFMGPYSHDKYLHCRPGDILIDDRTSNCREWEAAGGLSHIYQNWHECHSWLEATVGV